jgi:hypothetical protein
MRVEVVVSFRLTEDEAAQLNPLLPPVMPGVSFREGGWQVRFHHAPEVVKSFARALVEVDVGFDVREERLFKSEEIERAPALKLHEAPVVPVLRSHDNGSCSHRGRADEKSPNLRLAVDGGFRFAKTPAGDLVVDEAVAAAMIREHVEGCLLRPVEGTDGRDSRYFEVVPVHRLPPMHSPPTRFARHPEGACPECGQGGVDLVSPAFYDCKLEALADVNATFETLGGGDGSAPGVLVSQKLWRILRDEGVEEIAVEPVLFV